MGNASLQLVKWSDITSMLIFLMGVGVREPVILMKTTYQDRPLLFLVLNLVAMLGCLISRASVHKMLDVCRHPRLQPLSLHSLHSPLNSHMTLAG